MMAIVAWFIIVFSILASGSALFLALSLARAFRSPEGSGEGPEHHDSLSVLVPIKGAGGRTPGILQRLLSSALPGEVQYVIAMESKEDPAFPVCDQLRKNNPDQEVLIVISGTPQGVNGKQHNLAHAFKKSRGEILACMDADIEVEPDTIHQGLSYLGAKDAGSAFFLPAYGGYAPLGGLLVNIYLNYHYNLYMGALATFTNPPYIFGGLWMTRRSSLERTCGFGGFGHTVSDDAAIGRTLRELGLRNVLIPKAVHMENESLGFFGGLEHLGKWIGMLRAEGITPYFVVWLWWHHLFWSTIFFVLGIMMGWFNSTSIVYGALGVGLCLSVKAATCAILNVGVYRQNVLHSFLSLLAYELLAVPVAFGFGLFRKNIKWKGRRYHLGSQGVVLGTDDPD